MLVSRKHAPPNNEPLLCPVGEAARLLGLGRTKTYELLATGDLASIQIGTRRLVKMESIRALIERATGGAI